MAGFGHGANVEGRPTKREVDRPLINGRLETAEINVNSVAGG